MLAKNDLPPCYRIDGRAEVDNGRESWRNDREGGRKRDADLGLAGAGFFKGFLSGK